MITVVFEDHITEPWTDMSPTHIGARSSVGSTPDGYVLVSNNESPFKRIDFTLNPNDYDFQREALSWKRWIAIGLGERIYLVADDGNRVIEYPLDFYFNGFYPQEETLFAVSGEKIIRVNPDGSLLWVSEPVAVDGVNIFDVNDEIITGDGECDPPGGWREFKVDFDTGKRLND